MTGLEMIMGMGFLDGALVDEALTAEKKTVPISFRRGLAAACVSIVFVGGILAALYFTSSENDPGVAAIEADNAQIGQSGTPEHEKAVVIPPQETPERLDQRPQETRVPVQTDPQQTEITALPEQTNDPNPQGAGESEQPDDSQPGMVIVPEQPDDLPPRETPLPTPTPQNGETVAPTVPPESMELEPLEWPREFRKYSAEESFLLDFEQDASDIIVTLRKQLDRLPYIDYDSDYTDVQWETNGFEVLAQRRHSMGEEFVLRLSPEQPVGRAADFTMHIMDGDKIKVTLHFYAAMTERGIFFGKNSTSGIWEMYYQARCAAGEYTYAEYVQILKLIFSAEEPSWEDPIPEYLRNRASDEASGETSDEASGETSGEASG